MFIVPVKVKHGDSNDMITTYGMLHKCSQGYFIQDNLVKELGVHGMKITLNLKTLYGGKTNSTMVVEVIQVTGMSGDGSLLTLTKLYARREIPVDKKEIATSSKIKEWKHLGSILNGIVQKDDVQVGLLIGANCMKALEPTKIMNREGGGPYAYKTKLGSCVVGPINCISKGNTASCNRVADRDAASSELASHHFVMEKSVKDVSLEEMFQAIYQHDFREPELVGTSTMLKCGEVLLKDKKPMENLEMGTSKKDDHYVVPFPFRDPNFMFPNNRKKPVQRLMGLKRRFMKDNKFFQDYPRLMDNMLRSSYAKRSDSSPSGKTWYIPLQWRVSPE